MKRSCLWLFTGQQAHLQLISLPADQKQTKLVFLVLSVQTLKIFPLRGNLVEKRKWNKTLRETETRQYCRFLNCAETDPRSELHCKIWNPLKNVFLASPSAHRKSAVCLNTKLKAVIASYFHFLPCSRKPRPSFRAELNHDCLRLRWRNTDLFHTPKRKKKLKYVKYTWAGEAQPCRLAAPFLFLSLKLLIKYFCCFTLFIWRSNCSCL